MHTDIRYRQINAQLDFEMMRGKKSPETGKIGQFLRRDTGIVDEDLTNL